MSFQRKPWLGVDLDGTLAHYIRGQHHAIGEPIAPMMEFVKRNLSFNIEVRIFTARAAYGEEAITAVSNWLEDHGLKGLQVTNKKDYNMIELYDDRARQVINNTGIVIGEFVNKRVDLSGWADEWIGVDFDGTLATYSRFSELGTPVKPMVDRVIKWLADKEEVRIMTARAAEPTWVAEIEQWCERYIGQKLAVTDAKDAGMVLLYDDRGRQVEENTGRIITE